jgi:hypothetical protein
MFVRQWPKGGGTVIREFRYSLYGLSLRLPIEIRGLPEEPDGERSPTIRFLRNGDDLFARAHEHVARRGVSGEEEDWFCHAPLPEGFDYLRWSGHFEFLVDPGGREIHYRAFPGASVDSLQVYLLAQVLSFALLRRGAEPLHATTVVIDGRAVAFVGDSGSGKSSLAAAFLASGYPILTDDLLVLQEEAGLFVGLPGMPRLKLYPDVVDTLLPAMGPGIEMNRWTPKRILPLDEHQFHDVAAPLAAVFILEAFGTGDPEEVGDPVTAPEGKIASGSPGRAEIVTLSSRKGFLELLQNTYNPVVDDSRRLRSHFRQVAEWAERFPLATLRRPYGLGGLPETRDVVVDHVRSLD